VSDQSTQALSLLQQYFPEEYEKRQTARSGPYGYRGAGAISDTSRTNKAFIGYKNALDRSFTGIQELVQGELPPDAVRRREVNQAQADLAGGWSTAGEIGADAVALGMGAGGLAKGIASTGIPLLSKAPVAVPLAEAIVGGATTTEDRGLNAGLSVLGALGGDLATRAFTAPGGGLLHNSVSPESIELMNQGVRVPPWKAVGPGRARAVFERVKAFPGVGSAMRAYDRMALKDWNTNIFGKATPPKPRVDADGVVEWVSSPVTVTGPKGVLALSRRFDDAYDAVIPDGLVIDATAAASARNQMRQEAKQMIAEYPNYKDEIEGTLVMLERRMPDGEELPMSAVKDVLDDLDGRAGAASKQGKGDLLGVYGVLRGNLEDFRQDMMPDSAREMLAPINQAYANYKVLQRAMAMRGVNRAEVFTPAQLDSAIRGNDRSSGKVMYAQGRASALQPNTKLADDVLGNELPDVGPGTAEKLLPYIAGGVLGAPGFMLGDMGMSAALASPTGQRALMGGFPAQAAARKYGPRINKTGRALGLATAQNDDVPKDVPRHQALARQAYGPRR
jgi:hypothetical protein